MSVPTEEENKNLDSFTSVYGMKTEWGAAQTPRAHLVLISARSRTTAITGVEPSPVAGSEV